MPAALLYRALQFKHANMRSASASGKRRGAGVQDAELLKQAWENLARLHSRSICCFVKHPCPALTADSIGMGKGNERYA